MKDELGHFLFSYGSPELSDCLFKLAVALGMLITFAHLNVDMRMREVLGHERD